MPPMEMRHDPAYDLQVLMESKRIEKDSGRMQRARQHAEQQSEHFKEMAAMMPSPKKRGFNNAPDKSKMGPK